VSYRHIHCLSYNKSNRYKTSYNTRHWTYQGGLVLSHLPDFIPSSLGLSFLTGHRHQIHCKTHSVCPQTSTITAPYPVTVRSCPVHLMPWWLLHHVIKMNGLAWLPRLAVSMQLSDVTASNGMSRFKLPCLLATSHRTLGQFQQGKI
jgi:hypothetical protein